MSLTLIVYDILINKILTPYDNRPFLVNLLPTNDAYMQHGLVAYYNITICMGVVMPAVNTSYNDS